MLSCAKRAVGNLWPQYCSLRAKSIDELNSRRKWKSASSELRKYLGVYVAAALEQLQKMNCSKMVHGDFSIF